MLTGSSRAVHDVVIVGAGAAGLAAASMLGRCGRRVAVVGGSDRANASAAEVHNLPYAEGVSTGVLYAAMEAELERYGVTRADDVVHSIDLDAGSGRIEVTGAATRLSCSRLVLANGIDNDVPAWVPAGCWGNSVFSCPYCHAYEYRGEDFVVVGSGEGALAAALLCAVHARSLTVVVRDPEAATAAADRVRSAGGEVISGSVTSAEAGPAGRMQLVVDTGRILAAGAVLVADTVFMRIALTSAIGLDLDPAGIPRTDPDGRSSARRVWVAGSAANPRRLFAEAVGSGLRVGMAIHEDLCLTG